MLYVGCLVKVGWQLSFVNIDNSKGFEGQYDKFDTQEQGTPISPDFE